MGKVKQLKEDRKSLLKESGFSYKWHNSGEPGKFHLEISHHHDDHARYRFVDGDTLNDIVLAFLQGWRAAKGGYDAAKNEVDNGQR